MTSCDGDLPPDQPLGQLLFLQKNLDFAELHIQKHIILQK